MSYRKDLDEYCDTELQSELGRRKRLRDARKCAYCEHGLATHTCKYKGRESEYVDDGFMGRRR